MESVNGSRMPLPRRAVGWALNGSSERKAQRHRYGSALLILYGDAVSREHLHRIPSQSCFLGEKLGIFFFQLGLNRATSIHETLS